MPEEKDLSSKVQSKTTVQIEKFKPHEAMLQFLEEIKLETFQNVRL